MEKNHRAGIQKKDPKTYHIPLRTLLIKKLLRLRHRHTNELILLPAAAHAALPMPAGKHLERLHGRAGSQRIATMLLLLLLSSTAIKLLMRMHRLPLVNILVRKRALIAREVRKRALEEARRGRGAAVGLGVRERAGEVVAVVVVVVAGAGVVAALLLMMLLRAAFGVALVAVTALVLGTPFAVAFVAIALLLWLLVMLGTSFRIAASAAVARVLLLALVVVVVVATAAAAVFGRVLRALVAS